MIAPAAAKPPRKYEDYNKEASDSFGTEQEWGVDGAQIMLQKVVQAQDASAEQTAQTSVIQQLNLSSPQASQYSFAVANQFRQGHMLGRVDNMGSVVGIMQQQFGPFDSLLQWTKRPGMPADMFCSVDFTHSRDEGALYSCKMMKGHEMSLQYLKSYGKRLALGTELKYQFPLRKTLSSWVFRYKAPNKLHILTGEVNSNKDFKFNILRRLAPSTSLVAELEHKSEKGDTNVRVGAQVNFTGQSSVRVQVDPELRVKAMATTPVGRSGLLSLVFQWDPASRAFRQGLDLKMQGGALA
eukprot:RCo005874